MSRESRLLFVTMAVSGTVLLLLAQFRFPEPPPSLPTAAPLERLAARASFEELATRIAQLETAIAPNLVVLRLASRAGPGAVRLGDLLARPDDAGGDPVRHVPALRVDGMTAVAVLPPNASIDGIVGSREAPGTAGVVAVDLVRGLARVRVPERTARTLPRRALGDLATPVYVVAVEGTAAGVTLRPVFLGRSDRFQSARWSQPLLPLGGIVVPPGALFFTLDGEFLGAAIAEHGTLALAGADETLQAANIQPSPPALVDPGVALQTLTGTLAAAMHVGKGVLVAEVVDDTPAASVLAPGDVIVDVDGQPAGTPENLLLTLSTRLRSGPVNMTVLRQGTPTAVTLQSAGPAAERGPAPLVLDDVRGTGSRVRAVAAGSVAAEAGLVGGDVILRAGGIDAPSGEQVHTLMQEPGAALPLVVRRGDRRHLVLLVRTPADGTPR